MKSMPAPDLFQWLEMNKKTGVLTLTHHERKVEKCICFKGGKIIFVSSRKEGEKLGEFLSRNGHIDEERMKEALFQSKAEGVPFTHYLTEKKIVPREFLIVAIGELAAVIFSDLLDWEDGCFEFSEGLPDIVTSGPVFLDTGHLIFEAVRKHDEIKRREKG